MSEGASETDLRDYLADHLDIIEDGLTIFTDPDGKSGLAYEISNQDRSIDILVRDSNGRLVVIELKI